MMQTIDRMLALLIRRRWRFLGGIIIIVLIILLGSLAMTHSKPQLAPTAISLPNPELLVGVDGLKPIADMGHISPSIIPVVLYTGSYELANTDDHVVVLAIPGAPVWMKGVVVSPYDFNGGFRIRWNKLSGYGVWKKVGNGYVVVVVWGANPKWLQPLLQAISG